MLAIHIDESFVSTAANFLNVTNYSFHRVNLDIPEPAEQVQHKPASDEDLAKAKTKKSVPKLVPKPSSAFTARYVLFSSAVNFPLVDLPRNLFLTEFREEHGENASADDFSKAWKGMDKTKLKVFFPF